MLSSWVLHGFHIHNPNLCYHCTINCYLQLFWWVGGGGGLVGCNKGYLADKNKLHIYCTVYIQDSPRLFVSTACKILWEFRKFSLQNIRSAWRVIYNNNINKILHLFIEVSVVQWIRAGMQRVRSTVQSYYLLDFFCNNIFFQKDAC